MDFGLHLSSTLLGTASLSWRWVVGVRRLFWKSLALYWTRNCTHDTGLAFGVLFRGVGWEDMVSVGETLNTSTIHAPVRSIDTPLLYSWI